MPPPHRALTDNSLRDFGSSGSSRTKLCFMDLPLETQKEIVKHVHRKDLSTLLTVSKHFHTLSSARLYSTLAFNLTHADDPDYYRRAVTRLADALHTLNTSEHNYAQYIKIFDVSMAERNADDVQKRILSKYHFEEEAAMMLNTSLLLVLRKAHMLEIFGWDVAIELSGYIYYALAKMQSLHSLRVRLDTRAVPRTASISLNAASLAGMPHPPPTQLGQPAQTQYSTAYTSSTSSLPLVTTRTQKANPNMVSQGRRHFSAFRGLRQLNILGIDDLEYLSEIATCMNSSSSTLQSLRLSLSQDLARRAKKPSTPSPPVLEETDPLDDEDDDDLTPPPAPPAASFNTPVNDAEIRREKVAQDSVLGKIFGLEPAVSEDKKVDKALKISASRLKSNEDPDTVLTAEMKAIVARAMQLKAQGSKDVSKEKEMKEVEKAIEKYTKFKGTKAKESTKMKVYLMSKNGPVYQNAPAVQGKSGAPILELSSQQMMELFGTDQPSPSEVEAFMDATQNSAHWAPVYTPTATFSQAVGSADSLSIFGDMGYPHKPMPGSSGSGHYPPYSTSSIIGSAKESHINAQKMLAHMMQTYPKATQATESKVGPMFASDSKDDAGAAQADIETSPDTSGAEEDTNAVAEDTLMAGGPLFPAVIPNPQEKFDDMDIDMEHPDIIDSEDEDVQDSVEASNPDSDTALSGKIEELEGSSDLISKNAPGKSSGEVEDLMKQSSTENAVQDLMKETPIREDVGPLRASNKMSLPVISTKYPSGKAKTAEQTMEEYIRIKHGFHIEHLALYLIPLKASVMMRALDVSCLQQLSLLGVGAQGGFWSFMDKIQKESSPLQLRSIHTDDVSMAFLRCISNFSGLKNLFMMARSSKDPDLTTNSPPASIVDIRTLALRTHLKTLKRLMIHYADDDSWDLDLRTLRLLMAKGGNLTELACAMSLSDYHNLLQGLTGLKSLVAFHILAIRTRPNDHYPSVSRECRRFFIDTIKHCPDLKIRYVGMDNTIYEIAWKKQPKLFKNATPSLKRHIERTKDIKGKGKAKMVDGLPADASSVPEWAAKSHEEDWDEIESGSQVPEMTCIKHMKFHDLAGIEIFRKEIRTGRM